MSYQQLVAEHEAIEHACTTVLRLSNGAPRPDAAAMMLEDLAEMVRDHLAHEDPVVYDTVKAVGDGRHTDAALTSLASFEALKIDWCSYLERWDRDRIARDWGRFGAETDVMLAQLTERVSAETAVLYSLAVHYDVLEPGSQKAEPWPNR